MHLQKCLRIMALIAWTLPCTDTFGSPCPMNLVLRVSNGWLVKVATKPARHPLVKFTAIRQGTNKKGARFKETEASMTENSPTVSL